MFFKNSNTKTEQCAPPTCGSAVNIYHNLKGKHQNKNCAALVNLSPESRGLLKFQCSLENVIDVICIGSCNLPSTVVCVLWTYLLRIIFRKHSFTMKLIQNILQLLWRVCTRTEEAEPFLVTVWDTQQFELYWQSLFHQVVDQKQYLSSASQDNGWLLMSLANRCESTPSNPHIHFDCGFGSILALALTEDHKEGCLTE